MAGYQNFAMSDGFTFCLRGGGPDSYHSRSLGVGLSSPMGSWAGKALSCSTMTVLFFSHLFFSHLFFSGPYPAAFH